MCPHAEGNADGPHGCARPLFRRLERARWRRCRRRAHRRRHVRGPDDRRSAPRRRARRERRRSRRRFPGPALRHRDRRAHERHVRRRGVAHARHEHGCHADGPGHRRHRRPSRRRTSSPTTPTPTGSARWSATSTPGSCSATRPAGTSQPGRHRSVPQVRTRHSRRHRPRNDPGRVHGDLDRGGARRLPALNEATEKIVVDLLENPGYLGTCFATVGKRNWTFSAWENVEAAESALSRGAHAQAMALARSGGIGKNARGLTSIWKPERLNNYVVPAQGGSSTSPSSKGNGSS